ncbi:hypothetical protein FZ046_17840 [Mycolicibacterium grossiae]|nr:hypothetical protein FZ046_17840 [Mycolicibacterium grossiae]
MRKRMSRVGAACASLVAVAGLGFGSGAAHAEPAAGQQVRYSVTVAGAYPVELFYLVSQPPSMEAYNADPYAFMKRETLNLDPGTPWVFETTLADPQWAILSVSSTTRGMQAAPNPHCDIAIDGQVAVQQDAPYNPRCQLTKW